MSSANELMSYQTTLEDVLTWLLEDEDKLKDQSVPDNLDSIKDQFHEHEVNRVYLVLFLLG